MSNEIKTDLKLAMPSAAKIIEEKNLDINSINGTGVDGRVTKGDVLLYLNSENNSKSEKNISSPTNNVFKGKENGMDVLVPVLGESVVEATVSKWIKKQGDYVEVDDPIIELETDKVTLEVPASVSGILENTVVSEGDTVEVGALLGTIVAGEKPIKNKDGKYLINIKNKSACIVSFLDGKDKKSLNPKNCYDIGKMIGQMHLSTSKIKLYRKNSMGLKNLNPLLNSIKFKSKKFINLEKFLKISFKDIKKDW